MQYHYCPLTEWIKEFFFTLDITWMDILFPIKWVRIGDNCDDDDDDDGDEDEDTDDDNNNTNLGLHECGILA